MTDEYSPITRRDLLRSATIVGAAAAVAPVALVAAIDDASAAETAQAFANLNATESTLLQAIVERLIPSDGNGPGAKEARVAYYIDKALGDALATSRNAYAMGLAALDKYSLASRGKSFLQLSSNDQDSVLIDCETGGATGFTGSSAQFFGMLLNHTKQGMFGDPFYGGNANFVGWDLIGYPGVRTAVTASDQKLSEANELKFVRKSAYDYSGFHKASEDGEHHGG